MRKTVFSLFLLFLLALSACAPISPASSKLTPLTFMAGYKPQANLPFVGAYVAKEKGFFAQNGLDVTIEHSPGQGEHLQLLVAGKVQVTTMDAATLLQRRADPGLPVVSIALIGQKGQQAFAALASAGLKSPKDWEGKTVGYKGTPPPDLYALLAAAGADVNKVKLVNVGFDPRVLAEKQVDVYPLFKSNEPDLLNSWGHEITLWDAADYGVPTLGLTYVTSETYLAEHRDELTRFLRSVLAGIAYAEKNPDEAVQIVMKYAGPETDPRHMKYMLETELKDAQSAHGFGWQSAEQWQALANMLVQNKALPTEVDVNATFETGLWQAARLK
jgi:ABC-type nitrate/sulfonate/bicarbonate transport system substrate-binding protein